MKPLKGKFREARNDKQQADVSKKKKKKTVVSLP